MGEPILRLSKVRNLYHFSPLREGYTLSFAEKPMAYTLGDVSRNCNHVIGYMVENLPTKAVDFMWTEDNLT